MSVHKTRFIRFAKAGGNKGERSQNGHVWLVGKRSLIRIECSRVGEMGAKVASLRPGTGTVTRSLSEMKKTVLKTKMTFHEARAAAFAEFGPKLTAGDIAHFAKMYGDLADLLHGLVFRKVVSVTFTKRRVVLDDVEGAHARRRQTRISTRAERRAAIGDHGTVGARALLSALSG